MTSHPPRARGFTLAEMAVAVAVVGIVLATAFAAIHSQQERSKVTGTILDLHALMHAARQEALASGDQVVVMFFPDYRTPAGGTGRVIVYRDGNGTFFRSGAPVNLDDYDPTTTDADTRSEVVTTLDLERGYLFGPPTGQGSGRRLPAPFDNLPVDSDCTFCGGGAGSRRGAVAFDYTGRATFYSATGAPLGVTTGGSVTIAAEDAVKQVYRGETQPEIRSLAVVAASGALRFINSQLR